MSLILKWKVIGIVIILLTGTLLIDCKTLPKDTSPSRGSDSTAQDIKSSEQRAKNGHLTSLYNLGYAYRVGKGVSKDLVKSYSYYYIVSKRCTSSMMYEDPDALAKSMTEEEVMEGRRMAEDWWRENCYNFTKTDDCSETMEMGFYLDEKNRFSIIPPDESNRFPDIGKEQVIAFIGKSDLKASSLYEPRLYVQIDESSGRGKSTLPEEAESYVGRLYSEYEIIGNRSVDFGTSSALIVDFNVDHGPHMLRGAQAGISCGDRTFTLTVTCPRDVWEKNEPAFMKSFASLKCLD